MNNDDNGLNVGTEIYIPKANRNWGRHPCPFTLKTLTLRYVIKCLSLIPQSPSPQLFMNIRNYLKTNLLDSMFGEIILEAQNAMITPESLLNVYFGLPREMIRNINLLGFYQGTECCKPGNSTNWIYGYIPEVCVNYEMCKKLFLLLKSIDIAKLQIICLWARDYVLQTSNLPFHLAKASNLTKLVIRGDADNHLLRIIGCNCPSLKYLDVARSPRISHRGILNLVLKEAIGRRTKVLAETAILSKERRPMASSLETFILTKRGLGTEWLQLMSKLLYGAYLTFNLPEVKFYNVVKAENIKRLAINIEWTAELVGSPGIENIFTAWISMELWCQLQEIFRCSLHSFGDCQLDVYSHTELNYGNILRIYAHKRSQFHVRAEYSVSTSTGLISLQLFWDDFNWEVLDLVQFQDIIVSAPNIVRLSGRFWGEWSGVSPVLPHLTEIRCWTVEDVTVISILRTCPSLRIIDIKNVRIGNILDGALGNFQRLDHPILQELMTENPCLWPNIEEFMIRPTNLIKNSIELLIQKCPKILRIGDLECWNVTSQEISDLNSWLYNSQSQCALVILGFPPQRISRY